MRDSGQVLCVWCCGIFVDYSAWVIGDGACVR